MITTNNLDGSSTGDQYIGDELDDYGDQTTTSDYKLLVYMNAETQLLQRCGKMIQNHQPVSYR